MDLWVSSIANANGSSMLAVGEPVQTAIARDSKQAKLALITDMYSRSFVVHLSGR